LLRTSGAAFLLGPKTNSNATMSAAATPTTAAVTRRRPRRLFLQPGDVIAVGGTQKMVADGIRAGVKTDRECVRIFRVGFAVLASPGRG
jgi:hypothetical protein